MTIYKAFGPRAKAIAHEAEEYARCTEIAAEYARDTLNGPGQADYDLERAAKDLRKAAGRIEEMLSGVRAARTKPQAKRIDVLTCGHQP